MLTEQDVYLGYGNHRDFPNLERWLQEPLICSGTTAPVFYNHIDSVFLGVERRISARAPSGP